MSTRNRRPLSAYGSTVELEFRTTDGGSFLVAESERASCELVVEEYAHGSGEVGVQFVSVYGAPGPRVLSDALSAPAVADARIVAEGDDATLLELVVAGPSLVATVADGRAIPRHVSANRGEGRVVAEVPPSTDPQRLIDLFRGRHPDSRLVVRREYEPGAPSSRSAYRERLLDDLTDRQRESLVTAFDRGYFDYPRTITAAECAAALDISQSTFSQHLRVALYKLLTAMLGDRET